MYIYIYLGSEATLVQCSGLSSAVWGLGFIGLRV